MGELTKLQKAFTEHLRDPDHVPVPAGLDERRMGVYSELIFNNVSSLLSDFFPVIKSIVSDDAWRTMVRNFFISHESQTPYFMALSGEFVEYLAQAQLSALKREQAVYEFALENARRYVQDYLDLEGREALIGELDELANFVLDRPLPDISGSLNELMTAVGGG